MKTSVKKLFLEMGTIILAGALFGIVWNHKMLCGVWSGKPDAAHASASATRVVGGIPLPAGLLQVREMYDRHEAVFVDARDPLAFANGHIKGAVTLPLGQFDGKVGDFAAKVPLTATLVVYCNGYDCHDSTTLGEKLMARGYRKVFVFQGGYPEWKDAGLPVEGVRV